MRPLALLNLVGAPVTHHIAQILHAAWPERFGVSENLARIADSDQRNLLTEDGELAPELAGLLKTGDSPLTGEQVRERALTALADEIRRMLDERVVADPKDIDLCLILGAGWPFHLGGITPYLRRHYPADLGLVVADKSG
jgi:3-hydroxyacyl-CoA dehydrogenase